MQFSVSPATVKRARSQRAFLNERRPARPALPRLAFRWPQRRSSRAHQVRRTWREGRRIALDRDPRQCSDSSRAPNRCRGRIGGLRSAAVLPEDGTPGRAPRANQGTRRRPQPRCTHRRRTASRPPQPRRRAPRSGVTISGSHGSTHPFTTHWVKSSMRRCEVLSPISAATSRLTVDFPTPDGPATMRIGARASHINTIVAESRPPPRLVARFQVVCRPRRMRSLMKGVK